MQKSVFRRYGVTGLVNLAVAAAYLGVARLGTLQVSSTEYTHVLFPAAGLAVAALLVLGLKVWPGIWLGSFATSLVVDRPPAAAAAVALGTTVAFPLTYVMLRKVGFHIQLDRMRDALALATLGAVVGMLPVAVLRATMLVLTGTSPTSEFWGLALFAWAGLAMGVLVVTPFLLAVRMMRWPRGVRPLRVLEAVLLLTGTAAVTFAATVVTPDRQLLFLVFPLLIWAAWRFQLPGSTTCVLMSSAIVIYALFQEPRLVSGITNINFEFLIIEAFLAATSLGTLFLAMAVTERNRARDRITDASVQLLNALNRLDQRLQPRDSPLIDPARLQAKPNDSQRRRPPSGQR